MLKLVGSASLLAPKSVEASHCHGLPRVESSSLNKKEDNSVERERSDASVATSSLALNTEDSQDCPDRQGVNAVGVDMFEPMLCVKASSELAGEADTFPDRTVASVNQLVADCLQKAGKPAKSCGWDMAGQSTGDIIDHVHDVD